MSMFNKAVKPILSSFKGAKSGILGGAAMGGGAGAVYGGVSDNHTALGMGVAGAIAGGFGGREYKAFKGYQGAMNSRTAAAGAIRNAAVKNGAKKAAYAPREGMEGFGSYASKRFDSLFS